MISFTRCSINIVCCLRLVDLTLQAADKRERSELAHIRSGRYYSEPIDEICPSLLGVTQLNGLRSRISQGRLDFNIDYLALGPNA